MIHVFSVTLVDFLPLISVSSTSSGNGHDHSRNDSWCVKQDVKLLAHSFIYFLSDARFFKDKSMAAFDLFVNLHSMAVEAVDRFCVIFGDCLLWQAVCLCTSQNVFSESEMVGWKRHWCVLDHEQISLWDHPVAELYKVYSTYIYVVYTAVCFRALYFKCISLYTWPAKRHSSNISVSVSTPSSDCRWNSLSWLSLHLSAE